MAWTLPDIIFISILCISGFLGFFSGMVSVMLGMISFVLSTFAANYLNPYVIDVLKQYISDGMTVGLVGYFVSLVLAYCAASICLSPLYSAFGDFNYSIFNKLLGVVAGVARGVIINSTIFLLLAAPSLANYKPDADNFKDGLPTWLSQSQTLIHLADYVPWHSIQSIGQAYFVPHKQPTE